MVNTFFNMLGGLGLFLFGMRYMAEGLQKAAGDRMRKILQVLTGAPLVGVLVGTIVTMVIQSSSATTVMVVGFVNAGLMTIRQAVGVIMGANIGTTITAQIVAFHLEVIALPAIGIGAGLLLFSNRRMYRYVGEILLGFGVLFLGIDTMKSALKPLAEQQFFIDWMTSFSHYPVVGVLIGIAVTAIIQSSSATTAILLAIASQGIITLEGAIPIVLGSNIGTTVTALLSSIGTNVAARRTAVLHTLMKVLGTGIFLLILAPFTRFVLMISPANDVARQVANAHTAFNIMNTVIWLPFIGVLVSISTRLVKGEDFMLERGPKYLDYHALGTPSVALSLATKELTRMADLAREMLRYASAAFLNDDDSELDRLNQYEDMVDELEPLIVEYLATLLSRTVLTDAQGKRLTGLMHAATDIERIADHAVNIGEAAVVKMEQKLPFSDLAMEDLKGLFERVTEAYEVSLAALCEKDRAKAKSVLRAENEIDKIQKALRQNHIDRLNEGKCYPGSGVVYIELLGDLERIADHSVNIAEAAVNSPEELEETIK
jgi:phosphate:Na+ symporter